MTLIALPALGSTQNTLKDTQFVVEKTRKNVLPEAARLFRQAPSATATPPTNPLTYQLEALPITFETLPRKTKVLRAKQDVFRQLYDSYLRGGYGNYFTPSLEAFWKIRRGTDHSIGLYSKFRSTGHDNDVCQYDGKLQLQGEKFVTLFDTGLRLQGALKYDGAAFWLSEPIAGTSVKKQPLAPLHQVRLQGRLSNYNSQTLNYQLDAVLHYLRDTYKAHERGVSLKGRGDYPLNDDFTLEVEAGYDHNHHPKAQNDPYHMGYVQPQLSFNLNNVDVQVGLNIVGQKHALDSNHNHLRAYPALHVQYMQYDWARPYVAVEGNTKSQTLYQLLQENPLTAANLKLQPTHKPLAIEGGIKGDVITQISYQASLSGSQYKHLHCWVNDVQDPRLYQVQYDPSATVYRLSGALTWSSQEKTFTTRLRGNYFFYTLQTLKEPWHRPQYQIDMLSTYKLYDKILLKGTLTWLGGRKALDVQKGTTQALNDVIDLGVGAHYLWSSRISIFAQCQNLLNRKNTLYLHYPTRGIHFMAGLAYAW